MPPQPVLKSKNMEHHHTAQTSDSSEPMDPIGLKDPVCGMKVTAQSTYSHTHAGHTYFFCGSSCQAKFSADPQHYLAAMGTADRGPAA